MKILANKELKGVNINGVQITSRWGFLPMMMFVHEWVYEAKMQKSMEIGIPKVIKYIEAG